MIICSICALCKCFSSTRCNQSSNVYPSIFTCVSAHHTTPTKGPPAIATEAVHFPLKILITCGMAGFVMVAMSSAPISFFPIEAARRVGKIESHAKPLPAPLTYPTSALTTSLVRTSLSIPPKGPVISPLDASFHFAPYQPFYAVHLCLS